MGIVNLGQVAALIQEVTTETLPEGATPTVRNTGTKANAKIVFGLPEVITTEAVEAKARELIDSKLINYFKNGYIQWPGMPSPLEDTSLHFEGYSWYEVNYDGNFFRAKGRNAKAFSSKKLTKEQIKNGDYIFQEDEQGDAIRNITGTFGTQGNSISNDADGAFYPKRRGHVDNGFSELTYWLNEVGLDLSKIEGLPTAEENRSRNLTFAFWVLIKNE